MPIFFIRFSIISIFVIILLFFPTSTGAEVESLPAGETPGRRLTLSQAVMCEEIKNYQPVNPAVVFSFSLGELYCFTSFSTVPEQTVIDYKWYRRDDLVTTRRVALYPPKWSSYSNIHMRAADIGPWRVEIVGPGQEILDVLRFSITR